MTRLFYHSEGVKHWWWLNRKNSYSPAFQDYLAGTSPPEGIIPLDDFLGKNPA